MPKKGDNMIVAVQAALEHSVNASAVFHPRTDKSVTVSGVYTRDYIEAGDFTGYLPIFTCMTDDAGTVKEQDIIELTSAMYSLTSQQFKVVEKQDNGAVVQMMLHKQ